MKISEEQFKELKKNVKTLAEKIKEKALWLFGLAAANKKISIPSAAAVLIIILAIFAAGGSKKNQVSELAGQSESQGSSVGSAIPVPDVPLEENAYPKINELFAKYYKALKEGDLDTIQQLKSYTSDVEKIRIQKKTQYIEDYPKVDCYTKIGPMQDSYIVYVYYETVFFGYEEKVPGIRSYFVCPNEAGDYWIIDGEIDENVENYMAEISAQEDVSDLFLKTEVQYKELVAADEELSAFLDSLSKQLDQSVSEELAAQNAEESETEAETENETETEEEQQSVTQTVAANDVVNIRSSDSETADKLGKAEVGQQFTLLENRGNGWSKIDYNGREAFIKTEFLTVVDTQTAEATQSQDGEGDSASTEQEAQENQQTATGNTPSDPSGKTVMVKESVNIRKSASESGERIATVYQGEVLEVIMKQADGWTKIKYNGQTAYVKSDYVE